MTMKMKFPSTALVLFLVSNVYAGQGYIPCSYSDVFGNHHERIARGKVKTIDSTVTQTSDGGEVWIRHQEFDEDGQLILERWTGTAKGKKASAFNERIFQYASDGSVSNRKSTYPHPVEPSGYANLVGDEVIVVKLPNGDKRVKKILWSERANGVQEAPKIVEYIDRVFPLPGNGERHVCLEKGVWKDGNWIFDYYPHGDHLLNYYGGSFNVPRLPSTDDEAFRMLSNLPKQLSSMDPRVLNPEKTPYLDRETRYTSSGYSFFENGIEVAAYDMLGIPQWERNSKYLRNYSYKYDAVGNWVEQREELVFAATPTSKEHRVKAINKRTITYW